MSKKVQTCIHCGQPLKTWQQKSFAGVDENGAYLWKYNDTGHCDNPTCCVYEATQSLDFLKTIPADYLKKAVR